MSTFSRRRFLNAAGVLAASAAAFRELLGRTADAADSQPSRPAGGWNLKGTIVEACSCDVSCPCPFGSSPSAGDCSALLGWHIDDGKFGDVVLDGFNVAVMFYAPGFVSKGNWKLGWYVDERADPQQREALGSIFSGKAGGSLAFFDGPLVGERLGVKVARIEYEANGKRRRITMPRLADADITAISGRDGADVTLNNLAPGIHTSATRVVAKSTRLTYQDNGFDWNISGKNGNYSEFTYSS